MATNNNIQLFTALDIEKYHKGLLSAKEMHALEKAALEDSFLADALEGYHSAGVNVAADLSELKNRLGNRLAEEEEKKVVPMNATRKPFPWFRAAAAVVIIAGGALLANQFLFNKKNDDPALAENKPAKQAEATNTTRDTGTATLPAENKANTTTTGKQETAAANTAPAGGTANPKGLTNGSEVLSDEEKFKTEEAVVSNNRSAEDVKTGDVSQGKTVNNPAAERKDTKVAEGNVNRNTVPAVGISDKDLARNQSLKKSEPGTTNGMVNDDAGKNNQFRTTESVSTNNKTRAAAPARKVAEQDFYDQRSNVFRGRVTDVNNVGVPFANVTNVEDKVGTYTDAYGNFNLTSPDSTLTVQVRSIGFENRQVQLRNTVPANQVVMQDDRQNISEVVISNQKPAETAARNRDANKTLQEPEPVVGWNNYNTYAANNLEIPDEIKSKQSTGGSVQISFEVDKYGDPVNIRVEKSLCSKCDQEAIRLIKDGPKWKRATKKSGRTTVTINF